MPSVNIDRLQKSIGGNRVFLIASLNDTDHATKLVEDLKHFIKEWEKK